MVERKNSLFTGRTSLREGQTSTVTSKNEGRTTGRKACCRRKPEMNKLESMSWSSMFWSSWSGFPLLSQDANFTARLSFTLQVHILLTCGRLTAISEAVFKTSSDVHLLPDRQLYHCGRSVTMSISLLTLKAAYLTHLSLHCSAPCSCDTFFPFCC